MGSVFSKPDLPKPEPITVAAPIIQSTSATPSVDTSTDIANESEQVADIVRKRRPQTILTSFRGVLTPNNAFIPQRKSLLGE